MDPSEIVRSGYNAKAGEYLQSRLRGKGGLPLIDELFRLIPAGSTVLDAGCGAGVPLTAGLAHRCRVIALDFSLCQLRMAAKLVPEARLVCQDLASLGLASASVDAVCSFYAIIHIPRDRHRAILQDVHRIVRPGGHTVLCLGAEDLPEDFAPYQGVPMFWSHFDAPTYLRMLDNIGLPPIQHEIVPDPIDGTGGHLFVLSRRAGA
jgi:SAM-dependent methyltransferase